MFPDAKHNALSHIRPFRSSAIRSSLTPMQMHQRAQSHAPRTATNWLRNQLTCLGLVPHVHMSPRRCCPSRRVGSRAVCACRCGLPLLHVSPVGPTATITLCAKVPAWSTPRMRALLRAERGTGRCSHSSLVAGDARQYSHTVVGRCVAKCTRLRARSHAKGALDVGSMLPKAPVTSTLVRNTRTHKGRKNNEPRGVHPFVNFNVMRTAAHPRAALPSHNVQSSHPSPTT